MTTIFSALRCRARSGTALAAVALASVLFTHSSFARDASRVGESPRGSKAETETYAIEIKTTGTYKSGTEGAVEISLSAKGNYHINPQYPYKFKVNVPVPDGLSYPKTVLLRSDGSFEAKKASFKLPFTAANAGKFTVAGVLFMSVCSDANCILDKVPLEVSVEVK